MQRSRLQRTGLEDNRVNTKVYRWRWLRIKTLRRLRVVQYLDGLDGTNQENLGIASRLTGTGTWLMTRRAPVSTNHHVFLHQFCLLHGIGHDHL